MKFEEVLPALREGKRIKRNTWPCYKYCYVKDNHIVNQNGELYVFGVEADILQDDWEIVKEPKKVKLRDLTEEQLERYCDATRGRICSECVFRYVNCEICTSSCWIKHKDLYSDKFLDQEIEIEE